MKFLLDTCALSELVKPSPNGDVLAWINAQTDSNLFISSLTLGELLKGIEKLQDSKRKLSLTTWVNQIREEMADRILPFDHTTAGYWANLCANAEKQGKPLSVFDSLIASTAIQHGLIVVTRNTKDFEATPVILLNPWDTESEPLAE